MKAVHFPLLCALCVPTVSLAQNDIENVVVETYYVSDANDATDTIGSMLAPGSKTYRIFLDLAPGSALIAIYGNADHTLKISSTADFFNNLDRGKVYGHQVQNGALDENTVALDSWLSMGAASTQKFGVPKNEDPDGSIIGGGNNDGGSAEVPGGLLVNNDAAAGIPLTEQDGLVPVGSGSALPPSFNVLGDEPSRMLGDSTLTSEFISNNSHIGCSSPGVQGPTTDNRILIAQLTTAGDLFFELNIEVLRPDGVVMKYVADDSVLLPGEAASGLLVYPQQCGCTDPDFLEYDGAAGCDDGSCLTPIVFGCMDTEACNYDWEANFSVPQLCCYGPDNCNGLDFTAVCPDVGIPEPTEDHASIAFFPNPAHDRLSIRADANGTRLSVSVHDLTGRAVIIADAGIVQPGTPASIDLSALAPGPYLVRMTGHGIDRSAMIIKE